jgi:Domain of unknown function (DUF4372)
MKRVRIDPTFFIVDLVTTQNTIDKSIHFSGQPTFSQLINLIPKQVVANCIEQTQSDQYYKKFTTWHCKLPTHRNS